MEDTASGSRRRRTSVRLPLTPEMAEALDRRARRNDRFPWLEVGRIVRETLIRDGDLPAEQREGER